MHVDMQGSVRVDAGFYHCLEPRLANGSPRAKSNPLPVLLNKSDWNTAMPICSVLLVVALLVQQQD